mmetsp:Transcript_37177/g.81712  ORF Transcript_37177/g.81712 Transcript_37177/m.81712 type:complete len:226 (-) Transcript_37177:462-1139(-)
MRASSSAGRRCSVHSGIESVDPGDSDALASMAAFSLETDVAFSNLERCITASSMVLCMIDMQRRYNVSERLAIARSRTSWCAETVSGSLSSTSSSLSIEDGMRAAACCHSSDSGDTPFRCLETLCKSGLVCTGPLPFNALELSFSEPRLDIPAPSIRRMRSCRVSWNGCPTAAARRCDLPLGDRMCNGFSPCALVASRALLPRTSIVIIMRTPSLKAAWCIGVSP